MTLLKFIEALSNKDINVTVIDGNNDNVVVIEFKNQGIAGVESDVSARPVKKWRMVGATSIEVTLGTAEP